MAKVPGFKQWYLEGILNDTAGYAGTELHRQASQGLFEPLNPYEMLLEERLLVQNLEVQDCYFRDTTALNQYTLAASLPQGKGSLLQAIEQLLQDGSFPGLKKPTARWN